MSQQTIVTVNPDAIIEKVAKEIVEHVSEEGISKGRKIIIIAVAVIAFLMSGNSTILSFVSPTGETSTTRTTATNYTNYTNSTDYINDLISDNWYTIIEVFHDKALSVTGQQISSVLNMVCTFILCCLLPNLLSLNDAVIRNVQEKKAEQQKNIILEQKLETAEKEKEALAEQVERLSTQNDGIYCPNEPIVSNAYANPSQNLTPFENPSRYPSSTSTAYPAPVPY